jgi:hypothetical protein
LSEPQLRSAKVTIFTTGTIKMQTIPNTKTTLLFVLAASGRTQEEENVKNTLSFGKIPVFCPW